MPCSAQKPTHRSRSFELPEWQLHDPYFAAILGDPLVFSVFLWFSYSFLIFFSFVVCFFPFPIYLLFPFSLFVHSYGYSSRFRAQIPLRELCLTAWSVLYHDFCTPSRCVFLPLRPSQGFLCSACGVDGLSSPPLLASC